MVQRRSPISVSTRNMVGHYEDLQAKAQGGSGEARKVELLTSLKEIIPEIVEKYAPEKIILFGSLATGTVHSGSDIDLIIIKKTAKRPLDRQRELLELVSPRVATDFFIYTPQEFARSLREERRFLKEEVLEKGKVLYDQAA